MKIIPIFILILVLSACTWNESEQDYLKITDINKDERILYDENIVPEMITELKELKGTQYLLMSCRMDNGKKYSLYYFTDKQISNEYVLRGSDCDGGGFVINDDVFISSNNAGKHMYELLKDEIFG